MNEVKSQIDNDIRGQYYIFISFETTREDIYMLNTTT